MQIPPAPKILLKAKFYSSRYKKRFCVGLSEESRATNRASGGMANNRKELNIAGPNLWYLVGLITSDGCLCKDGRHVDITSSDKDFLMTLKERMGFTNCVCVKNKSRVKPAYRIQVSNKSFYEFLLSIGLTPKKSLSLGALKVPRSYFFDFVRGVIDGDGSIRSWIHPSSQGEQWSLRIYSGSAKFLDWLRLTMGSILEAKGKVHRYNSIGSCHVLKFGKMAARDILMQCYYPNNFSLTRKDILAEECVNSYVGWKRRQCKQRKT